MDYHPEFPLDSHRLSQCVDDFHRNEHYFMPNPDYLQSHRKMQIRKHAIRTIAQYTVDEGYKAFIPYIALNYFDCFISRHTLPDFSEVEDKIAADFSALCCLTMAMKLCIKSFSLESFLRRHNLDNSLSQERIQLMECKILDVLERRSRPITPFCFLNHYYTRFKCLGGFSRRCINQIIINSLADERFTKYKPSLIAFSTFLAAAHILYGPQRLNVTEDEVTTCFREMIEVCMKKNIEIEPECVEGEIGGESLLYPWTKSPWNTLLHIEDKASHRDWNFDVQWLPTGVRSNL